MRIIYSFQGKKWAMDYEGTQAVIGRWAPQNDIDLDLHPDMKVSRRHAQIWQDQGGHYWIKDLGSTRGTLVDGVDIRGQVQVRLYPEVPVLLGDTELQVAVEEEPSRPTQTSLRLKITSPLPPVRVTVDCLPVFNYSLVHAGVPFLSQVTLFNDSGKPLKNVEIQLALAGYAASAVIKVVSIAPRSSHTLDPSPQLSFDTQTLRDLAEPETVLLRVWVNNKQLPLTKPIEVKVLPPNAWHCVGHEIALAGFVMPNSDAVNEVIARARFGVRRLFRQANGFADAIESGDPKTVEKILKAIYFCLEERYDLIYENEPRTYAPDWQLVRFQQQTLSELQGTCIDLALLFAACLENIHLDPLLIIIETGQDMVGGIIQHALIGCWTQAIAPESPVIYDEQQIRTWVESGAILLLDSKGFTPTWEYPEKMTFVQCQKEATRYLQEFPLCYALDVVLAREVGLSPMPFGRGTQLDPAAWLAVSRAWREAKTLKNGKVSARHLLLGLLSLEEGLLPQIFAKYGQDVTTEIIQLTRRSLEPSSPTSQPTRETGDWQTVIQWAKRSAEAQGNLLVTEADLIQALFSITSQVDRVLKDVSQNQALPKLNKQTCLYNLSVLLKKGPFPSEWRISTRELGLL
jgi:hypothetical protein